MYVEWLPAVADCIEATSPFNISYKKAQKGTRYLTFFSLKKYSDYKTCLYIWKSAAQGADV